MESGDLDSLCCPTHGVRRKAVSPVKGFPRGLGARPLMQLAVGPWPATDS